MKKSVFIYFCLMFSGVASLSNAEGYSNIAGSDYITSSQLRTYKESLDYLNCYYKSTPSCSSREMAAKSRKLAMTYKNMAANGINASKKAPLDALAAETLPQISLDEAKEFVGLIKEASTRVLMENYASDDAIFSATLDYPSPEVMEKAEVHDFTGDLEEGRVTSSMTMSRSEVLEMVDALDDEPKKYKVEVPYLKGVEFDKQISYDETYTPLNDFTVYEVKREKEEETVILSMITKDTSIMKIKRYPENNYNIKIFKSDTTIKSSIKEGIFTEDKKPVINIKADFSVKDNEPDNEWVTRYDDIRSADAALTRVINKQKMLDLAVTSALRSYENSLEEEDETKKQKLLDRIEKSLDKADEFYKKLVAVPASDYDILSYYNVDEEPVDEISVYSLDKPKQMRERTEEIIAKYRKAKSMSLDVFPGKYDSYGY